MRCQCRRELAVCDEDASAALFNNVVVTLFSMSAVPAHPFARIRAQLYQAFQDDLETNGFPGTPQALSMKLGLQKHPASQTEGLPDCQPL